MPVKGVPAKGVGLVVQDFVNDGVPLITASLDASGSTYTVSEASGARGLVPPRARATKKTSKKSRRRS